MTSHIEVLLGGGRGMFTPQSLPDPEYPDVLGRRVDNRNLLQVGATDFLFAPPPPHFGLQIDHFQ